MNGLLEELTDIYLADLTREKLKAEKSQALPSENKLSKSSVRQIHLARRAKKAGNRRRCCWR